MGKFYECGKGRNRRLGSLDGKAFSWCLEDRVPLCDGYNTRDELWKLYVVNIPTCCVLVLSGVETTALTDASVIFVSSLKGFERIYTYREGKVRSSAQFNSVSFSSKPCHPSPYSQPSYPMPIPSLYQNCGTDGGC